MSEEVGAVFLANQLTLFRPRCRVQGADIARYITTGPPRFLNATASLTNICNVGLSGKNSVTWLLSYFLVQIKTIKRPFEIN